jgi:broad specificity phosphatase PhoE
MHASFPLTGTPAVAPPFPGAGSRTRLWLVRHAEVHEDWQGRAYGNLDVPLSVAGEAQSAALARSLAELAPALVTSSPLARARVLGEAVAQACGAPLAIDARLAEICRGRWQGLSVSELHERWPEEVRAFYADPWRYDAHGGENDSALLERAAPAITALLDVPGRTVVVATHYNVIRVLVARALEVAPQRSFGLRVDPAHAVLLVDGPRGWELLHANVPSAGAAQRAVAREGPTT